MGRDFGKALVRLETLKRLYPGNAVVLKEITKVRLLQGREIEEDASRFEYERDFQLGKKRKLSPTFGVDPVSGFQMGMTYVNDAISRERDRFFGALQVGSKDYYFIKMKFETESDPLGFYFEGKNQFYQDRYYGIGNHASAASLQSIFSRSIQGKAGIAWEISDSISSRVGLFAKHTRLLVDSDLLGGEFAITWKLSSIQFQTRAQLANRTSKFHSHFELEKQLSKNLTLKSVLGIAGMVGNPTPGELIAVGEEFNIPGMVGTRFRDRSAGALWVEPSFTLWGPLSGGLFASLSRVGSEVGELFEGNLHAGWGTSLEWQLTRHTKKDVRLEIAKNGDEWLFTVGAQREF